MSIRGSTADEEKGSESYHRALLCFGIRGLPSGKEERVISKGRAPPAKKLAHRKGARTIRWMIKAVPYGRKKE